VKILFVLIKFAQKLKLGCNF